MNTYKTLFVAWLVVISFCAVTIKAEEPAAPPSGGQSVLDQIGQKAAEAGQAIEKGQEKVEAGVVTTGMDQLQTGKNPHDVISAAGAGLRNKDPDLKSIDKLYKDTPKDSPDRTVLNNLYKNIANGNAEQQKFARETLQQYMQQKQQQPAPSPSPSAPAAGATSATTPAAPSGATGSGGQNVTPAGGPAPGPTTSGSTPSPAATAPSDSSPPTTTPVKQGVDDLRKELGDAQVTKKNQGAYIEQLQEKLKQETDPSRKEALGREIGDAQWTQQNNENRIKDLNEQIKEQGGAAPAGQQKSSLESGSGAEPGGPQVATATSPYSPYSDTGDSSGGDDIDLTEAGELIDNAKKVKEDSEKPVAGDDGGGPVQLASVGTDQSAQEKQERTDFANRPGDHTRTDDSSPNTGEVEDPIGRLQETVEQVDSMVKGAKNIKDNIDDLTGDNHGDDHGHPESPTTTAQGPSTSGGSQEPETPPAVGGGSSGGGGGEDSHGGGGGDGHGGGSSGGTSGGSGGSSGGSGGSCGGTTTAATTPSCGGSGHAAMDMASTKRVAESAVENVPNPGAIDPIKPETDRSGSFTIKQCVSGNKFWYEVNGRSGNKIWAQVTGTQRDHVFKGTGSARSQTISKSDSGPEVKVNVVDETTQEAHEFLYIHFYR